jgi:nitrile hydratase accessory protein
MILHDSCKTDQAAPQFDEEWQRRAFGLALALSEFGHYSWDQFQENLIANIGQWEDAPSEARTNWQYYDHWVHALQAVVDERRLLTDYVPTDERDHALTDGH